MTQKIEKFVIHQFKGVRGTIEIQPDGPGCILIAGPNGAGKSSVVDGIMQLVSKETITEKKGIPKPIHDGKDGAFVEMTTSKVVARVAYKKDDAGTLTVTARDGGKYSSPKAFMVEATGGQVFDTAEFEMRDPKEQRAELLRRVELPFDVDKLTQKAKGFYDARTDVGRDVTRLTSQLAAFAAPDPALPSEEVSATAILAEHAKATEHNRKLEQAMDACAAAQEECRRAKAEVDRLADELDAAQSYEMRANETAEALLAAYRAGPELIDLTSISARLETVEADNSKIRAQAQRARIASELASKTAEQSDFTAKIDAIEKQKKDGLATAVFPVKGLGIDDTGITFDGIPFRQVNAAQRIIVAFDLFTQSKPELRIIFIKNGDLLDAESLAGIEKIAVERGYYVVIERDRDESRAMGFTVKDGALV